MNNLTCEQVYKYYLPAVRAAIAQLLYKSYGMNQTQIAKHLGITQVAVYKILTNNRSEKVEKLLKNKKIREFAKKTAKRIAKEKLNYEKVNEAICKECSVVNFNNQLCSAKTIVNMLME